MTTKATRGTIDRIVQPGGSLAAGIAFDSNNIAILPGFVDVHVHLREPGFLYKETVATGTAAAAAGGFTTICSMPNLNPCPDSPENLKVQLDAIEKEALVQVIPYGAITKGEMGEELASLEEMADQVVAFTDDGRGVMSDELMRQAMIRAKALGKIIVAHCEDENYPRESSEAEWKQLKRDLDLVRETGCAYHMCHVSTKESLNLIRQAKAEGLDVTCETAPHYLVLTKEDVCKAIEMDGTNPQDGKFSAGRFKMNPPIKQEEDRQALLKALADGTIDMIATDHAPHSMEEKSKAFADCAYGIVGLETAFPVLYTNLVLEGVLSLEKLVELMSSAPAARFGLEIGDSYSQWDLEEEYVIRPEEFLSKGHSTPFAGWTVKGRCLKTVVNGQCVYQKGTL